MNELKNIQINQKIRNILSRMARLLQDCEISEWSESLCKAAGNINSDSQRVKREIRSLYGGSGSLNDIVLYEKGHLLIDENNEFDLLRTELFDLCNRKEDSVPM